VADLRRHGALDGRLTTIRRKRPRLEDPRVALGATATCRQAADVGGVGRPAVAPEKVGAYLRDFRRRLEKHGFEGDFLRTLRSGCLPHADRLRLETKPGIEPLPGLRGGGGDLVVSTEVALGEHGDGQSRAELLPKMFGPKLWKPSASSRGSGTRRER